MEILNSVDIIDGVHKWSSVAYNQEWALLRGNAVNALQTLEDESVHCIITSPPYYSLRDKNDMWSVTVNGNWRITFYFIGPDAYLVDYLDYH